MNKGEGTEKQGVVVYVHVLNDSRVERPDIGKKQCCIEAEVLQKTFMSLYLILLLLLWTVHHDVLLSLSDLVLYSIQTTQTMFMVISIKVIQW